MRRSKSRVASFGGQAALAFSTLLLAAATAAASDADIPAATAVPPTAERPCVSPEARAIPAQPCVLPAVPPTPGPLAPEKPAADAAGVPPDPESLLRLARTEVSALGPLSIGTPDAGLLVNPVPMPDGPLWTIRNREECYGTSETLAFVATAIGSVEKRYPGSPRVVIGDISRRDGGRLNRHRSHQAGRDADVGFYYRAGESSGFRVARKNDLDLPRSWALVRAFLTETDVDRIFVDRSLQRLLYAEALAEGEDREWLDDVFGRGGEDRKGIIQHEKRHKDHFHVRFFNPLAQERARIVYATLVEAGSVPPPVVKHRVRRGETLGHLAARYGTTASAIRAANGLRGTRLRAGRAYLIPVRRVPADTGPIVVPPRRLPPEATHAADAMAHMGQAEGSGTAAAR